MKDSFCSITVLVHCNELVFQLFGKDCIKAKLCHRMFSENNFVNGRGVFAKEVLEGLLSRFPVRSSFRTAWCLISIVNNLHCGIIVRSIQ